MRRRELAARVGVGVVAFHAHRVVVEVQVHVQNHLGIGVGLPAKADHVLAPGHDQVTLGRGTYLPNAPFLVQDPVHGLGHEHDLGRGVGVSHQTVWKNESDGNYACIRILGNGLCDYLVYHSCNFCLLGESCTERAFQRSSAKGFRASAGCDR